MNKQCIVLGLSLIVWSCAHHKNGDVADRTISSLSSATCKSEKYGNRYDVTLDRAQQTASVTISSPDFKQKQVLGDLVAIQSGGVLETDPPRRKYQFNLPGMNFKAFSALVEDNGNIISLEAMKLSDRFNMGNEMSDSSIYCGPAEPMPSSAGTATKAPLVAAQPTKEACKIKAKEGVGYFYIDFTKDKVYFRGTDLVSSVMGFKEYKKTDVEFQKYVKSYLIQSQGYVDKAPTATVIKNTENITVQAFEDVTGYTASYLKLLDKKSKVLARYYSDSSDKLRLCR